MGCGPDRQRVESLILAHERLYHSKDFARLKMSEYLSSLLLGIQQTFREIANRMSLHTELEDIPVSMDQAIPLGLIVTELVTNALKYAFPEGRSGILTISVKTGDGDEAVILVADNGVGLPRGLDWRQNNTLGLRLVHDLCRQIGETISLDRSKGVSWQIRFKKETL